MASQDIRQEVNEVSSTLYDNNTVETSGQDVPPPIKEWADVKLDRSLLSNIQDAKYAKPTSIQQHSIPIVAANRDLMGCAQTGSGKTAAFLIPIITKLLESNTYSKITGNAAFPCVLVLAPTRELAAQISDESLKLSKGTHLKTVCVFGGVPIRPQISSLVRGCEILIATPGRLIDCMERGCVALSHIRFLILDEADRMLDMGFGPQIRKIVEDKDMPDKKYRQTLLFSATFPREIQNLAASFLKDYVFVTVGKTGKTCDTIKQQFVYVEQDESRKTALVSALMQTPGLTLVFVERKKDAAWLEKYLRFEQKIPCTAIHGDKDQSQRMVALKSFATGKIPILIATNVAARGLDIPNVSHVVNFHMPATIEEYVHRIGRTGRAGKKGLATTFIGQSDGGVIRDLRNVLKDANEIVPDWFFHIRGRRGKTESIDRSSHMNTKQRDFDRKHDDRHSSSHKYHENGRQYDKYDNGHKYSKYNDSKYDNKYSDDYKPRDDKYRDDKSRDDKYRDDRYRDDKYKNSDYNQTSSKYSDSKYSSAPYNDNNNKTSSQPSTSSVGYSQYPFFPPTNFVHPLYVPYPPVQAYPNSFPTGYPPYSAYQTTNRSEPVTQYQDQTESGKRKLEQTGADPEFSSKHQKSY
mmetsp:Transcript_27483/g.38759  ORF Transcript_27483/g.38759 Transcript_27483/m.38759 type:complete len:636 (-) Transcript_27483:1744-3651(-)